MGIILWVIFGALVGWVASMIMGTNSQQGAILNIAVGIVGSVVGSWLVGFWGQSGITGFNFYSFVVALIGAVALIVIVKLLRHA